MLNVHSAAKVPDDLAGLPARMREPAGFTWGRMPTSDGAYIRWGMLEAPRARVDCVLVGGFCEIVEKYFELMHDLAARGISTWIMDWRGQGGSVRPDHRPNRPRARDIARDAEDLAAFARMIGPKDKPRVLIAHSLGAAIGLQACAAYGDLFEAAVLSGPLIRVASGGMPRWLAGLIASAACFFGFGLNLIPGVAPLDLDKDQTPEISPVSHDPVRCKLLQLWLRARPDLALDGLTFDWYRGAFQFAKTFKDRERFANLKTPVLLGLSGQDVFVDIAAARDLAGVLPDIRLVDFPEARHELFHERDDIRGAWLAAVDSFLHEKLPGSRP